MPGLAFLGSDQGAALFRLTAASCETRFIAATELAAAPLQLAESSRRRDRPSIRVVGRLQLDAIHWAGRQAQLAPGAQLRDDCVRETLRADDRIHRAGRQALGAADATHLIDDRNHWWLCEAVARVERFLGAIQQLRECAQRHCPTGWALV